MNTLVGKRWSLKWIATGLLAMSILGAEAGFTSANPNPTHRSENIAHSALKSPQAINHALDRYFANHHIWHGPLPLLPETLGVSTVINPKYSHAFIVNLVGISGPLNGSHVNPQRLPLGSLWGAYARAPASLIDRQNRSTIAEENSLSNAGLGMFHIPISLPEPVSTWHAIVSGWRQAYWTTLKISPTLTAYYSENLATGSTIVWRQDGWWCVLQGMLGKTRKDTEGIVRTIAAQAATDGGLPGRGTLYVYEAGDGEHTGAVWELGQWDYIVGNYHSTNLALTVIHRWTIAVRTASQSSVSSRHGSETRL